MNVSKLKRHETPTPNRDEFIYGQICEWIADGTLLPGQHLVPERLAEQLGTSRTPITNALKRLKQAGLVEWIVNSGAYVRRWSQAELAQLFELRGVLEGLAARHAATNISPGTLDELDGMFAEYADLPPEEAHSPRVVSRYLAKDREFHGRIIDAAENAILQQTIAQVHVTTSTFAAGLIRTVSIGFAEHKGIVEALRARDPELSERRMRQHLQRSVDWLRDSAQLERPAASGSAKI